MFYQQDTSRKSTNEKTQRKMKIIGQMLWRNWFGLAIALILLYLLVDGCNDNAILQANYKAATTKNTTYKNFLGTLTTQVRTLQLDKDDLEKQMNDTVAKLSKKFAKVESVNTVTTITQYDTIEVPFKEPIPCNFVREDSIRREWYSFKYRVDSTAIQLSKLQFPNKQIVITGIQRKWFLGKQTLVTEITNTNPHIKVTNATSIKTVIKPKWYESKAAFFIAGALTLTAVQNLTTK